MRRDAGNVRHPGDAVDRLQRTRAEIALLVEETRAPPPTPPAGAFPRSRTLRLLTGKGGKMALGSLALTLATRRPGLILKVLRAAPVWRPLVAGWLAKRMR